MKKIEFHNRVEKNDVIYEYSIIKCSWLLKVKTPGREIELYLFENLKELEKFINE